MQNAEVNRLQRAGGFWSHVSLMRGYLGMIFAAEGLRAVAAVPSSSKIIPKYLTYARV